MLHLTKYVAVIAKCECDKPAIINNDGRVERIVFHDHVLCVRWSEDGKQVTIQNSHNVAKDFKLNLLEELKAIFEDYLENHISEFSISLENCKLVVTDNRKG